MEERDWDEAREAKEREASVTGSKSSMEDGIVVAKASRHISSSSSLPS